MPDSWAKALAPTMALLGWTEKPVMPETVREAAGHRLLLHDRDREAARPSLLLALAHARGMDPTDDLPREAWLGVEAEAWGLVNRVVPDDDVDTAAAELAQQLADGPSWATGHAKRVVYHGYEHSLPAAGEFEGLVIAEAMGRHDGQEGIAAFAGKRRPEFTGE